MFKKIESMEDIHSVLIFLNYCYVFLWRLTTFISRENWATREGEVEDACERGYPVQPSLGGFVEDNERSRQTCREAGSAFCKGQEEKGPERLFNYGL